MSKPRLNDIYHQVPPDYWDSSYKNNIFQWLWYIIRFRALRKITKNIKDGANVLDIGCGSGFSIEKILSGNFNVYGIDTTQELIAYAKKTRPDYHFQVGYAESLSFEDNFFDAIFYLDVIEHLKDPTLSLKEARRVLKPEGIVVILVTKEHHPIFKIIWWIWKKMKGKVWENAHSWIFDENTLSRMIVDVGFNTFKIYKTHFGMSLLVVCWKREGLSFLKNNTF